MHWPDWLTWYKKPDYRDIKEYASAIRSGKRSFSPDRAGSQVPSQLKLERVLDNRTCSPMSLFDFYMYLKHIEFSEENLEFYIWHRNYVKRYNAGSAETIVAEKDSYSLHSTESTTSQIDLNKEGRFSESSYPSADLETADDTYAQITQLISTGSLCGQGAQCHLSCNSKSKACTRGPQLPNETGFGGITSQRKELGAIIQRYLATGAPKELNIPPAMRAQALEGLEASCDPIYLQPIADHVYQLLKNCSHRNFVRLGVSNGTFETICVATGLGIVLCIAGYLAVLLLAFTPHRGAHTRWTVFGAWPMWWVGMSLVMSGLRGSCFFLLLFTRRQPLPWERFVEEEAGTAPLTGIFKLLSRLMIFDRKFRVKDVHLRRLQHKIVLQSLFFGSVFATISLLVFIFLPVWA